MIRHFSKNGNKKNLATLREKIIANVAKHSRYPRDLYDACVRGSALTRPEFRQLLNEMRDDGDIRIKTNNRVLLPKPPPEAPKPKPPPEAPTPPREIENSTDTLLIHCLVNRSRTLKYPKQKKSLDKRYYYAHHNYKITQIPLGSVCEETLLKGFHIVPGSFEWLDKQSQKRDGDIIERKTRILDSECVSETKSTDRTGKMKEGETTTERIIKDGDAWTAQQVFFIEFDDTTESTPAEFIAAHPFLQQNAWLVTESLRSRYDDPDDEKCHGQLRLRIVLCMPRAVKTIDEREWVYDALVNALPGCDKGSANSITNGGLGKVGAEHVKIGKIVDMDWFKTAIATGQQKKVAEAAESARLAEQRKRKHAERVAMGFTEREGELPVEAVAKADPSHFLESLGLSLKSESGKYQRWGRTEKQGDIALSVWLSDSGNWQICVFANSIPTPPSVSGAMSFARFYSYYEFGIDIEGLQPDTPQWKDLNAQLASDSYGTWLSDDEFNAKHAATEKRTYTAPKRLDIDAIAQEAYKDTLCTPKSNEALLQDALNAFLQHLEAGTLDTFHIFLFKYPTGIGKSRGGLTIARKFSKKVLSLLFEHDIAKEQTETAKMLGFNAYRFRGRGYNFKKSKLGSIPLEMREQNETLFRDNDVMCPVYDKLEPYQNKRLNPYMLCFRCPLIDACKTDGYWSQFPELLHADYLAVCLQDLLFNPDFWTLLDTFLTGSIPFSTPETDEEAAIAMMLGLQDTDTQDSFEPFDFAMIDDYTTAGLYSEARYSLEEIANLKNAWAGTPTGDVLKQIHEAIVLLYHDSTQRAVDILTKLFDSLDDDTREAVNTNLTKHADRDEHGAVIPTAPWTALKKGIASLDTLTPVWHSKDWTLLHQLETLINHCKNTTQAPMFIDDDGNITLSIPPQVHPTLKAVLLMSATPDIENTQNGFIGQDVTFSVSEGKPSHWAKGVKGFQYVNARWTTQSIFEYQKDDTGKTVYDDNGKPIIVGLRPKAVEILQKLTELARADSRKCLFIGYKEFVEGEIAELPVVKALHEAFDAVTHYDIAPGKNFEGYKIFVTFGYPKIDWDTIKREARKQYAHDPEPLNFDYTTTNEQGEVYTSTHGRFTDPRVEKIRQQLTTEKLQQGNGRGRHTRWEDTFTLAFTAEPIPGFTELATPFVDDDWRNTQSFDLDAVIEVRRQAEQHAAALTADNTIEDFQRVYGCGREKARKLWHEAGGKAHKDDTDAEIARRVLEMKAQNIGERKIGTELGISYGKVRAILNKNENKNEVH